MNPIWDSQYILLKFENSNPYVRLGTNFGIIQDIYFLDYMIVGGTAGTVAYLKCDEMDVNIQKSDGKPWNTIPLYIDNNTTTIQRLPWPYRLIQKPIQNNMITFKLEDSQGNPLSGFTAAYFTFNIRKKYDPMLHDIQKDDFDSSYRMPIRSGF